MVKNNINFNFRNMFQHFYYFDFAYFINNSTDEKGLKVAFAKGTLIYLKRNDDQFLHAFKDIAFSRGYMNIVAEQIISANQDSSTHYSTGR